jgi:pimeloyl-ACP methyl ester carboxylesterase
MNLSSRKLKWGICAGIFIACILLWKPVNRAVFSIRLAWSLQKLASGDSTRNLAVIEEKIRRRSDERTYEARVYHPAKSSPTRAIVLAAGLTELGCDHPGIVALSRFLADKGLLVVTPDIQEFREFQISAEPMDQILFWYRQIRGLSGGEKVQKTGLAGISYSGTLALIAAAQPEIRDNVGFVVAVGPYCSLIRCTRGWFAADPGAPDKEGYPTRFYAKWIVMLSALDMLPESKDRLFLHDLLDSLLLNRKIPQAPNLTSEGTRWYRLATMRANQSDPELTPKIEKYLVPRVFTRLDPEEALGKIRCPVFLIHGAYDDLIPTEESVELHRKIADSQLIILPFLTHTHPTAKPLSFRQKSRAAMEALSFFYQFSKATE